MNPDWVCYVRAGTRVFVSLLIPKYHNNNAKICELIGTSLCQACNEYLDIIVTTRGLKNNRPSHLFFLKLYQLFLLIILVHHDLM